MCAAHIHRRSGLGMRRRRPWRGSDEGCIAPQPLGPCRGLRDRRGRQPTAVPARAVAKAQGLDWQACGDAPDVECATQRRAARLRQAVRQADRHRRHARDRRSTRRTGSARCSSTPAAPGSASAATLQAVGRDSFLAELNQRYDIVAHRPARRRTAARGAIDCKVNQETAGHLLGCPSRRRSPRTSTH